MTVTQEEYLRLYERGYGVREIARMLGKGPSTVSTVLKQARQPRKASRAPSSPCPHSSSCFTCPLHDCVAESSMAPRLNVLSLDFEYMRVIGM